MYASQESILSERVSIKITMELVMEYFDQGRTMYTDNWYMPLTLANQLFNR